MCFYNKILSIFLFALLASKGLGAEGAVLPKDPALGDYLRTGLENNAELRAAYHRYMAAMEKIPQAKSLPDPRISATHLVEEIQTRTGPQENQLMVSQTVPWFGKLKLRGKIASREAAAVYEAYDNHQLRLIRDIAVAYYEYAYLAKATRITRETLLLLERLEPIVETKVRGGTDLAPLLRLQVEIGRNRDELRALGNERGRQSAKLSALLNRRGEEKLPWPALPIGAHEPVDRGKLVAELLERNPGLQSLKRRIEKADRVVDLSKLSPIPDPTLGVSYLDTGSALNPAVPGSGDDPVGIQLSFTIPIWFGKYRAERREALANREAVRLDLTESENRLLAELDAAVEGLDEAEQRVALYGDKLLPTARQAVEVSETSYKADKSSILDFIDSERMLLSLEKIYWRAVADRHGNRVRLKTLTAGFDRPAPARGNLPGGE